MARQPGRQFPIVPLGVSAALFAADGVVASSDVNAGRTRWLGGPKPASGQPNPPFPRTLMLQGGAAIAGGIGELLLGWPSDITDALLIYGVGSVVRETAFRVSQGSGTASRPPVAAQPYRVTGRALAPPQPSAVSEPWGERSPVGTRI